VITVAVAIAVLGGRTSTRGDAGHGPRARAAAELAPAGAPPPGRVVDGISGAPLEQLAFHIHAHLSVYVNGAPRVIPAGIGIEPGAIYPLHTHFTDGVIHIESPVPRVYTLGEFFDVWGQPLDRTRVGPARGKVTAFAGGRRVAGDPRAIPLTAHGVIELDVGRPLVAPAPYGFAPGL
jgi:hypothetical protein